MMAVPKVLLSSPLKLKKDVTRLLLDLTLNSWEDISSLKRPSLRKTDLLPQLMVIQPLFSLEIFLTTLLQKFLKNSSQVVVMLLMLVLLKLTERYLYYNCNDLNLIYEIIEQRIRSCWIWRQDWCWKCFEKGWWLNWWKTNQGWCCCLKIKRIRW